jgi:hypothetical protein
MDGKDIIELVKALAWPLVTLVALASLKAPLSDLIRTGFPSVRASKGRLMESRVSSAPNNAFNNSSAPAKRWGQPVPIGLANRQVEQRENNR